MKASLGRQSWFLAVASLFAIAACDDPADPPPPAGSLAVTVTGLPDTVPAEITVSGPGGYSQSAAESRTFTGLAPGSYTIAARQVKTGVATFTPAFEALPVTVGANAVASATVIYTIATGSIAVTVNGAPPDVPWKVHVTGPAGYRDSLSANGTLGNLVPGTYTVSAGELHRGASIYAPRRPEFNVTVTPSTVPVPATISYALITASLSVFVNGLPTGTGANITITGPNAFTRPVTGSILLEGLGQGRYDVTASSAGSAPGVFNASPVLQSVTIIPGSVASVIVNYWPATPPAGINLAIDGVQVQQVVQTYGGAVPLVAGRDALVRVFVRASQPNAASPSVRLQLFEGAQAIATFTAPAPAPGVPTAIDEGTLASSWNVALPGSMLRPGIRLLAEVDPANEVAESAEGDNVYPLSGTSLPLDVRTVAPLAVRLVPVTQASTGLTGDVTGGKELQYADAARRMLPVGAFSLDVRAPYTTNAPPLEPFDANGAWVQILNELRALHAAEGSTAHYYGVVKVNYTSGLAGISYLPSVVALGWDKLPHGAPTMVHELGHNFGRLHSPSCGAGGFDANYPWPNGAIGVYGYDALSGTLQLPSSPDIMGYCDGRWISDYTYTGILGFRSSLASLLAAAYKAPARSGLLVWGRISASGVVLEPAFEVVAPPRLPDVGGPHRIDVIDDAGRVRLSLSFSGEQTIDAPRGNDEHFAFVIPMEALGSQLPARLRLSARGHTSELSTNVNRTSTQLVDDFATRVERISPSSVRVLWRDGPGRGLLVRDGNTGAILSFARGGSALVVTSGTSVDLTLSDGVRSARRSMLVR